MQQPIRFLERGDAKVGEILCRLRERGYGAMLILFGLPNCFLLPLGMSSIAGLPLIFFGLQLVWGNPSPWLPEVLARQRLSSQVLWRIDKTVSRLGNLCRERLRALTGAGGAKILGVLVVVLALSITIPLPLTNFLPAVAITAIGLGMLNRDGALVLLGIAIGVFGLLVTLAVLFSLNYLAMTVAG